MTSYSVGEQVTIRYGRHQGEKATIMKTLSSDAYKVKTENGAILFFTSKGLESENERAGHLA